MRISKLDIHNFRGFESAQIDFGQSNVSVFIGTNGQGKSTILDLIAILLQQFTSRAPKAIGVKRKLNEMKLLENDIRLGCTSTLNSISIFDSSIKIKQYLTWSISKFLDEPLSQLEEAETFYGSWKEKRKEMQLRIKI